MAVKKRGPQWIACERCACPYTDERRPLPPGARRLCERCLIEAILDVTVGRGDVKGVAVLKACKGLAQDHDETALMDDIDDVLTAMSGRGDLS